MPRTRTERPNKAWPIKCLPWSQTCWLDGRCFHFWQDGKLLIKRLPNVSELWRRQKLDPQPEHADEILTRSKQLVTTAVFFHESVHTYMVVCMLSFWSTYHYFKGEFKEKYSHRNYFVKYISTLRSLQTLQRSFKGKWLSWGVSPFSLSSWTKRTNIHSKRKQSYQVRVCKWNKTFVLRLIWGALSVLLFNWQLCLKRGLNSWWAKCENNACSFLLSFII